MNNAGTYDPQLHRFSRWRFDASGGELFDGQTTIRLEPQVAKLLDYFLIHQNTLISRDELMSAVWENRIVSDDAINRCVSILRQTLTPDDKNAFIETVVRRGFISHFPEAPAEQKEVLSSPRHRNLLVLVLLVSALAAVLYIVLAGENRESFPAQPAQPSKAPMVAVLPFAAFSLDDDSEFFARGMHDDLLTQLAQLESLRVISRTSVLEYRDSRKNIRTIGQELGADAILEGSVQSSGDQIRINVQLIDTATDQHLWAERYDRELSPTNIFAVQTEIASAIATSMQTTLTDQDAQQLKVLPTENMAAYRAYHRAMEIRDSLGVRDPSYLAALESAVALDPAFVRAWAELAGLLSFDHFGQHNAESIQRVEKILTKIRTIAPQSADYLIAQAYYTYYVLQNYKQAYELINQAQLLRPNDERVIELKSWIERRLGDYDARIESLRLVGSLDPRNPYWTLILVQNLIVNHQYEEAARETDQATIKNLDLAVLYSLLELRHTHEPAQWRESLSALEAEYGQTVSPQDSWKAQIASRDFAGAEQALQAIKAENQNDPEWTENDLYMWLEIITYWFLQDSDRLALQLNRIQPVLDESRDPNGNFSDVDRYLTMAFISAVEGNPEETKRMVRTWRREATSDLAEFSNFQHHACRALGMAAATAAAIECIRSGLVVPSQIMPFFEPYLPFYDAIRGDSQFAELLAELK